MKNFNYIQPKTLSDAFKYLKTKNNSSIALAGGTDVLGLIKNNIEAPENVVNLKTLKELNGIKYLPGKELQIGSLTTLADIAEHAIIKEKFTSLAMAAKEVASPQFRNIATIGGNICQRPRCAYFRSDLKCLRKGGETCYAYNGQNKYHCIVGGGPCYIVHPSDTAVALMALDAKVVINSSGKSKTLPISKFFVLPDVDYRNENVLKPGDILEMILIPETKAGIKSVYVKFKERDVWDFAIISVAANFKKENNRLVNVNLSFGGVAPIPWQSKTINELFEGITADEISIKAAADKMFVKNDVLEMNGYKIPLVRNITKRLLMEN